jgi:DNA repair exonuclease SbcCD ATPase subunit
MIIFKRISAKNFLSIGEEPIEYDITKGLNIIFGTNNDKSQRSNGSGKSTSVESIYFAIFGKTMRKLNQGDIVNKDTKKNTEVVLDFSKADKDYRIIRTLKPSSATLLCKNTSDEREFDLEKDNITRDSIENTQKDIVNIIGASEDIVKNSVIMGIGTNHTTPFLEKTKMDKRKHIEGIFDMGIFADMLKDARKDYNSNISELTKLESETSEKERNYTTYVEQSSKFEESKRIRIEQIVDKLKGIVGKYNELNSQVIDCGNLYDTIDKKKDIIKEFEDKISNLTLQLREKVEPKRQNYRDKLSDNNVNIKYLKKSIDDMFKEGECPTCKREMSEHDKEHVKQHIEEIETKISVLEKSNDDTQECINKVNAAEHQVLTKISEIEDECSKVKDEVTSIEKTIREQTVITDKLKDIKVQIDDHKTNIETIKGEKNTLGEIVERVDKEIKSNKEEIDKVKTNVEVLDKIKFILSDNGVKSYMINKMMGVFNTQINHYLERLDANCVVTFDEYFEVSIINDRRKKYSYHNLSNGERRNVDISVLLAFMDLQKLQGKFDCNLMVFDEILDGCLDPEGVGFLLDIINEKGDNGNKSIYIITHRKEISSNATGEVFEIYKQNGFSKKKKVA